MPDTNIDDIEFRQNAEAKAMALGLDSFLLWNVSTARLYVRTEDSQNYAVETTWSDLEDITDRESVVANRERWQALASTIVGHLNDMFDRGVLEGRPFIESFSTEGITALIKTNASLVKQALEESAKRDADLRNRMTLWWLQHQHEYLGSNRERTLAQAVMTNWLAKILLAHILREKDVRARGIVTIEDHTTPKQALQLFEHLSQNCNFWTVFCDSLGLATLPDKPWGDLKQLNRLLSDLRIGSVGQEQFGAILETAVEVARRKLRGQYTTPMSLAHLLVNLCLRDIASDRLLDPCCGSGTIARAALEQKLTSNIPPETAANSVLAGDQDPHAALITTFALANPDMMHIPLRVFQRDAFSLSAGTRLVFQDPTDGTEIEESLGLFQAITCNLPFISQKGRDQYADAMQAIIDQLGRKGLQFSKRADIAAYFPFALHPLLSDQGRLGVIITNAWLGTDWGDDFYAALRQYYDVRTVITSGVGRWFQNSDVVTNILILEKKVCPEDPSGEIKFVVLNRPLDETQGNQDLQIITAQIEQGQSHEESASIRTIQPTQLDRFRAYGLGGTAQFVDSDWVLNLPLTHLHNHFEIRRGERRGKNALFYPAEGHGIEAEYIQPLIKGPEDFAQMTGAPTKDAFLCSRTEEEMRSLGHHGALNWIDQFRTQNNIQKLSKPNIHWYEMTRDNLVESPELAMFINYGDRLFVGGIDPLVFIDQRVVRLIPKANTSLEVSHALLNSTICMFFIEGMGFGRGLGALDLNKLPALPGPGQEGCFRDDLQGALGGVRSRIRRHRRHHRHGARQGRRRPIGSMTGGGGGGGTCDQGIGRPEGRSDHQDRGCHRCPWLPCPLRHPARSGP